MYVYVVGIVAFLFSWAWFVQIFFTDYIPLLRVVVNNPMDVVQSLVAVVCVAVIKYLLFSVA
jgi:hypothetical protein